jgi:hypothetical protein
MKLITRQILANEAAGAWREHYFTQEHCFARGAGSKAAGQWFSEGKEWIYGRLLELSAGGKSPGSTSQSLTTSTTPER